MLDILVDSIFFIYDNISLFIFIVVALIIGYSWISMFIHEDYKFIADYNRKYKDRVLTIKDLDKIKYEIEHMEGRQFEIFSEWLFKKMDKYKSVTLTSAVNDEGRDLILVNENNDTIFVECKRYTENATVTEDFMIGREICQKLTGAIVADGIKQGIIVTTGNIHQNAWDYIVKLEENSDIRIEIMNLSSIMRTIQEINSAEVLRIVGLDY